MDRNKILKLVSLLQIRDNKNLLLVNSKIKLNKIQNKHFKILFKILTLIKTKL
jgi:hypothetical protein